MRHAAILPGFIEDHPDVEIVIERAAWPDVVEEVAEGRLDAAVANILTMNRRVREESLFEDDLVAIIPPSHEWAGRASITLRELAEVPLIFTTRGGWFSEIWSPALKQLGVQLNTRFELTGYPTIMELVRKGVAVALMPLSAADPCLPVARVTDPGVTRTLGWLEPAAPQGQPALDDLKEMIRSHLERLRSSCIR